MNRPLPVLTAVALVALTLLVGACPKAPVSEQSLQTSLEDSRETQHAETTGSDFEADLKRICRNAGQDYFILERPAYDGVEVMKIAVLYKKASLSNGAPLMPPVGVIPGFTAGGFLYLEYTRSLVDAGYVVFLPDIKGDYLHFIGLEPFVDPFVDPNFSAFRDNATELEGLLLDYTGDGLIGPKEVYTYYKALYNGEVDDQALADLYRQTLFAYRGYSLDLVVKAMFEVNEDPAYPVYGRINTDRIGLEAHSLGPDEVIESVVRRDGESTYSWSDHIAVALLKGAVPTLQRTENFERIDTPVIFMNGEYDDPTGVIAPTWQRFNVMHAPSAYIIFHDSGHVFFIDPPIGFLGDKLLPFFGNFEGIQLVTYRRNRADMIALCLLVYDAYLKQDSGALKAIETGDARLTGEYYTRNM
ncbi:MAG: hypothetical protein AMXMBFR82_20460 [Candidatus Hydrogenedentota bacterium]